MNGIPGLLLFIYSAFTVNLLLQCGLGIKGVIDSKNSPEDKPDFQKTCDNAPFDIYTLTRSCIIFLAVIVLWFFFSKIIFSLIPGIYIYVLLFPVSFIFFEALEYLTFRYVLKKDMETEKHIHFPGGITAVAVFLCINIANNVLETIILSFGFASGIFIIVLIIREIRRRAALEAVPVYLRGKPLILVTMGMLSLVLTTVSFLLFGMIGAR